MINVLYDGNLLFHRWASFLGKDKDRYLINEAEIKDFIQNLTFGFYKEIHRHRNNLGDVYFLLDGFSRSWRKRLKIENGLEYKSGRENNFNYDRSTMHEVMVDFCLLLKSCGVKVVKSDLLEADDLIYSISDLIYSLGGNVLIISADSDMPQLLQASSKNFVIIYHNYQDKYVIPSNMGDYLSGLGKENEDEDSTNIFGFESYEDKFKTHISSEFSFKGTIERNPFESIFLKTISGDKNDTIPSVFMRPHGQKEVSFGEKSAEKLYALIANDGLTMNVIFSEESQRKELAKSILSISKVKPSEELIDSISQNIKRNVTYAYLNKIVYPSGVFNPMESYTKRIVESREGMGRISGFRDWKELLVGTKYEVKSEAISYRDRY